MEKRIIDNLDIANRELRNVWHALNESAIVAITDRAGKNTPTLGASTGSSSTTPAITNAVKSYKYYPVKAFTLYDEIPAGFQGKIMPKITEFNSLTGDSTVSVVELESVNDTVSTLTATSRYHSSKYRRPQKAGCSCARRRAPASPEDEWER